MRVSLKTYLPKKRRAKWKKEESKMQITINQIMSYEPCYKPKWILEMMGGKKSLTPLEIARLNGVFIDYKLWLLLRNEIIPETQLYWLATDFAVKGLPFWWEKYPNDRRLADAIQAKRDWLMGDITDSELVAAVWAVKGAASETIRGAARAAWAVWNAAWNVVCATKMPRYTVRDVSYATMAARYTARDVSWAAAWCAKTSIREASEAIKQWQLDRVVQLLEVLEKE